MKQRFLFFRSPNDLTRDTVFYHVWIGSSRDQLLLSAHLRRYAKFQSCYFQKWTPEVCTFYEEIANILFAGSSSPILLMKRQDITPDKLLSLLNSGNIDIHESNWHPSPAIFKLLSSIDAKFYIQRKSRAIKQTAPTDSRKNLSHATTREVLKAAVGFLLILGLYLLGAHLDYLYL